MEGFLEICKKINKDCEEEIKKIIEEAKRKRDLILEDAKKTSKEKEASLSGEFDKKVSFLKERFLSLANSEKKQFILNEKNKFIEKIFSKIKEKAEHFRKDKRYIEFLKKSILEGLETIECKDIVIEYSFLDEGIFNKDFMEDIKKSKDINIYFKKGSFQDIGVILYSKDEHLVYDNRFSSLFKRMQENIYFSLFKEIF